MHNKCNVLESSQNPSPYPGLWKNCLSGNQPLVPKRLGTAVLRNTLKSFSCYLQASRPNMLTLDKKQKSQILLSKLFVLFFFCFFFFTKQMSSGMTFRSGIFRPPLEQTPGATQDRICLVGQRRWNKRPWKERKESVHIQRIFSCYNHRSCRFPFCIHG